MAELRLCLPSHRGVDLSAMRSDSLPYVLLSAGSRSLSDACGDGDIRTERFGGGLRRSAERLTASRSSCWAGDRGCRWRDGEWAVLIPSLMLPMAKGLGTPGSAKVVVGSGKGGCVKSRHRLQDGS